MSTYATRAEAIEHVIIKPIESSGLVDDARAEYDIDAIADIILGDADHGFASQVPPDKFWQIVEKHSR